LYREEIVVKDELLRGITELESGNQKLRKLIKLHQLNISKLEQEHAAALASANDEINSLNKQIKIEELRLQRRLALNSNNNLIALDPEIKTYQKMVMVAEVNISPARKSKRVRVT